MSRLWFCLAVCLSLAACVTDAPKRQDAVAVVSNAIWLAYLEGPQAQWRVLVSANEDTLPKTYTLQARDLTRRYALAMVCPGRAEGQPHQVFLIYASADVVSHLRQGCEPPPETRVRFRITGNIYDELRYGTEKVRLAFAADEEVEAQYAYATYVPEGTTDVLAFKGPVQGADIQPRRFVLIRDFEAVGRDGAAPDEVRLNQDLVFIEQSSFPATETDAEFSVDPGLSGAETAWRATVALLSRNGNRLTLRRLAHGQGVTRTGYRGLPARYLRAGEGHEARLESVDAQGRVLRVGVRLLAEPGAVALALPQAVDLNGRWSGTDLSWTAPAEDPLFGARRLVRWRLDGTGETDDAGQSRPVRWVIYATDVWLEEDPETGLLQLPLPDLAGLPGWRRGWRPENGFQRWRLEQYFSDDDAGALMGLVVQHQVRPGLAYGRLTQYGP